ncbi:MAG: MFS transporter [Mycobacteriaceae bacterium]|nr:MFS transporter [Mycobacteriaceae bacterium]
MLVVAILASFVAFLDGSVVNLALPAIARDLGGGLALQQWIVDSYLLTLGALILVAGSISDMFGRVRILRWGLAAFGAGSVLAAAAPSGLVLIGARLIQGVGAAFLVPSSLALINSTFAEDEQPRAIGIWTAWTGTAFVLGPLLGGLAVDYLSWRWIFILSAVPVAATFALSVGLTTVAEPSAGGARIDVLGAVLAAAGLSGTVYALIELQRRGLSRPDVSISLAVGLVSLAVFVWWQFRAAHPMLPMNLFAIRNFGVGNLATTFVYAGVSVGTLIVSLFLQEVAGFRATEAGIATLPLPILSFLLAARVGALAAKFGPRLFMAGGPLIAAAGFVLMRPQPVHFDLWTQLLPGLVLFGLGLAVTVTPLTSAVLAAVEPSQSGIGSAINNAVSRIAGLIAVALAGVIAGGALDYGSFRRLAVATAAMFAVGGVVAAIGIRNPVKPPRPVAAEAVARCSDRAAAPPARYAAKSTG